MAQIFHPAFNTVSRVSIFGGLFLLGAAVWAVSDLVRSPYRTETGVLRDQPVPFSHKHHVGGLGIDCRYCHSSVEDSSFAGIPSTQTCMNCHSQIWADSPMLEPVRRSFREGTPLSWTRVHRVADFAYFDHAIHVRKGVGCTTCHGPVNEMPLTWKQESLFMEWCLGCHREPERFLRPREQVFSTDWRAPEDPTASGRELVRRYAVQRRTDCSDCHR